MNQNDDFYTGVKQGDEADRKLVVRFSIDAKLDQTATADKEKNPDGHLIYRDREFITILIPGDKTLTVHRPVGPADRARFAMAYKIWKDKKGEAIHGTPLAGWPLITESQRKELDYFHVHTVEQLAELNDVFAGNMMGVQQLKSAAQKYLVTIKDNAPTVRLMKELESRDNDIAALRDQVEKMAALMEKKSTKDK